LRGDILWVSKLIGFVLSVFLINFTVKIYFFKDNWLLQYCFSMLLSLVVALLLGFLNYKKVRQLKIEME
jgi:hypothetical protein